MPDAPGFTELIARRREIGVCDEVNTALIVSDHAKRIAFSGDHQRMLREGSSAGCRCGTMEYAAEAWVRVVDFDSRSVTAHIATLATEAETGTGAVDSRAARGVEQRSERAGGPRPELRPGLYGDAHNGRPR